MSADEALGTATSGMALRLVSDSAKLTALTKFDSHAHCLGGGGAGRCGG